MGQREARCRRAVTLTGASLLRRVSVTVPAARAEEARAVMLELFPDGFEEVDGEGGALELAAYTNAAGEERLWQAFGGAATTEVENDWQDRWRQFHRPVRVGRLWIGPPWEKPPADAVAVVIDPGQAFGTGGHPTTQLCLQLLEEEDRGSVLDLGCGSGVLSIAAAKLGFTPVRAIDFDPHAVEATVRNARANGVTVDAEQADLREDELPETDLALANIAADVVRTLGPRLRSRRLITSGYLVADEVEVDGYRRVSRVEDGGWAADVHVR